MQRLTFLIFQLVCTITLVAQKPMTLENLYKDRMMALGNAYIRASVDLPSDPESYMSFDGKQVSAMSYVTGKEKGTLFTIDDIPDSKTLLNNITSIQPTSNAEQYLIECNTESIYRHSTVADHYIYNTHYKTLTPLSKEGRERCVEISQNGLFAAFVRDGNIFLKKLRYNSTSAITEDGEFNKIINGAPDWVYEEEFSTERSLAFSPDNSELAYIRYDESEVPEFAMPMYDYEPSNAKVTEYPGEYRYKYPKAGAVNSKVSVHVYDVLTRKTKEMQVAPSKGDYYIPRIYWTSIPHKLAVVRLNRRQNVMDILIVDTQSTVAEVVYTDKDKSYVDEVVYQNLMFLPDGKGFLVLSEQSGYMQLYHYNMQGILMKQITSGDYDVMEINGFDAQTNSVIYTVAKPLPTQRRICVTSLDGKRNVNIGDKDGYYEAKAVAGSRMLMVKYSTANTPNVINLYSLDGKLLRNIDDKTEQVTSVSSRIKILKKEFMSFKADDGKTDLNAWMVKPASFSSDKKYPVFITQYSGPNSQQVKDKWSMDWEQVLASQGYIVVCVDPRGTGARGADFKKCTYLKLGKYETEDIAAVARQLGNLPYVDASRIGIWGWSYGGFMSCLSLCRYDVFKAGIAVAPVTSWRFYDSIYTERFMRTPEENPSGYDDFSPITIADKLNGKLFIIHGTADDNVHYQNQMEFIEELIAAGKEFDMFTFPNQNHSLPKSRYYVYSKMLKWIKANL
ncbi:MAG: S9 family peptidase [Bacteroidales bacterium]|nr:S9 family peptidase [Bacteroidales bacterium]